MKPVLVFALSACGIALAQPHARADSVSYQLINQTELSFDYSLQLANMQGRHITSPSYLGKSTTSQMSVAPILGPGERSPWQSYQLGSWQQADGVAFNMLLPDGRRFGMKNVLAYHSCNIARNWGGTNVMFVLEHEDGGNSLQLIEYTPEGGHCTFGITEGYGPTLWDAPLAAAQASTPAPAGAASAPW